MSHGLGSRMRKFLAVVVAAGLVSGCSAAPRADGSAPTPLPATRSAPAPSPMTPAASSGTKTPVQRVPLESLRLQSRWWEWAAVTEKVNPVLDETGAHCGNNQPEDVWLVAGTFGGEVSRACGWPAGRPLAGPVVNRLDNEAGCQTFLAEATGSVTFDGRPVPIQRLGAEDIRFTAQAGNPSGLDAGLLKGVACGLWFAVPPAAPGRHVLVIRGSSSDFATAATYNLTVRGAAAY